MGGRKLTKRIVDGAERAEREFTVWDNEVAGFGLRVYPSGRKAYVLRGLERVDGNPHVIVGGKEGASLVNLKDSWSAIRKAAGLEGLRVHDLRHSFASVGAAGGMSLPVIGALLGHREIATTARYAHLSDDPLKTAAEHIGSRIAAAFDNDRDRQVFDQRP